MTLEALAKQARDLANELFSADECMCVQQKDGSSKPSCIQDEKDQPLTRPEKQKGWCRRPFYGYDPARMCDPCAAYWWTEMAAQTLHNLHCLRRRAEARSA